MARREPIEIVLCGETHKIAPLTIDQISDIELAIGKQPPTQSMLAKAVIGAALESDEVIRGATFTELANALGAILAFAGFTPDAPGEGAGAPANATGSTSEAGSRQLSAKRRPK